jgi:hypothetical protein
MKINEIPNPVKIGIKTTKQTIDQKIDVPAPFIPRPAVYLICGAQGTGKSTLVNSLMVGKGKNKVFRGEFERVHYCTPGEVYTSDGDSHPMKDHNPDRLHFDLTPQLLNDIMDSAIEEKKDGGATMIVLDDFGEILKHKSIEPLLKRMIQKHRHLKLNIVITVVALKLLPRSLRSLIDMFIIFKPRKLEIDDYADNIFSLPRKEYDAIHGAVYKDVHDFMIFKPKGSVEEYYRNFNKLDISETVE